MIKENLKRSQRNKGKTADYTSETMQARKEQRRVFKIHKANEKDDRYWQGCGQTGNLAHCWWEIV